MRLAGGRLERVEIRERGRRRLRRAHEQRLEACFHRVERATERFVRDGALLVESRGRVDVTRARRELRAAPEQLRARGLRQRVLFGAELVDRRARSRVPPEVEIEVHEVDARLLHGEEAARALSEIDGGLEVLERARDVAFFARDARQVQARRRDGARVTRALGDLERFFVGRLGGGDTRGPLVHEAERSEREALPARVVGLVGDRERALQARLRRGVVAEVRLRDAHRRDGLDRERVFLEDGHARGVDGLLKAPDAKERAAHGDVPRARGGIGVVRRHLLEHVHGDRRLAAPRANARLCDRRAHLQLTWGQAEIDRRDQDGELRLGLSEAPELHEALDARERLLRCCILQVSRSLFERLVDVALRDDGSPRERAHGRAHHARLSPRSVREVLHERARQRGHRAKEEILRARLIERRHRELRARTVEDRRRRDDARAVLRGFAHELARALFERRRRRR